MHDEARGPAQTTPGRTWSAALAVSLACACGTPPAEPAAPGDAPRLERDARIEGGGLRFRLELAEHPNLVYQLDCVSGVMICARAIFRELWDELANGADDEAALATWHELRTRHDGEIRRAEDDRQQPLLAPAGVFALAERQRIVGLRARDRTTYTAAIAPLSTDADARALAEVLARFAPRFSAWWQRHGFEAGSAYFDGYQRLLEDPALTSVIARAARFYEAELPPDTVFRVHLLVQPRSSRKLAVGYQLEGDAVVEADSGGDPARRIGVFAHELFHNLLFRMAPERQRVLLDRVCASDDPYAVASYGMLDEAVAAALGNGIVGREFLPADRYAKQLARGFIHYRAAGAVARELVPVLDGVLDAGTTISSKAFLDLYLAAARRSYVGGRPSPIDYLHSQVSVTDPRFAAPAQKLREAAWAGFPYLREFAALDAARQFLADRPFVNAALFVSTELPMTEVAAEIAPPGQHVAAMSALVERSRGFVYALPRTPKSYAFVFAARDEPTMRELVEQFIALAAMQDGPLVTLPE